MLFDQKYPVHWKAVFFRDGTHQTDTHTTDKDFNLETELAQSLDSVKIIELLHMILIL